MYRVDWMHMPPPVRAFRLRVTISVQLLKLWPDRVGRRNASRCDWIMAEKSSITPPERKTPALRSQLLNESTYLDAPPAAVSRFLHLLGLARHKDPAGTRSWIDRREFTDVRRTTVSSVLS
jgi:hypothetical protein